MSGPRVLPSWARGYTPVEIATALVVLVVIVAIAVPVHRAWSMRSLRTEAHEALNAVLEAQEKFFATHTRYASAAQLAAAEPAGPVASGTSRDGNYAISLATDNASLTWVATAAALDGGVASEDTRCAIFRVDNNGNRTGIDSAGVDRSDDCWN
jgi:type IV pilus assembly protein PilE